MQNQNTRRAVGDMKANAMRVGGITASRPKLSILPRAGMIYGTRPLEYGADKYCRGNYYGPCPVEIEPIERVLGYLDAAQRHITRVQEAVNRALGTGGDLAEALSTVDDASGGGGYPASGLPDLAHAIASLLIGVSCAIDDGLLPEDPGQPWKAALEPDQGLPQKDASAVERARVAQLRKKAAR